jgi:hypothetical protein
LTYSTVYVALSLDNANRFGPDESFHASVFDAGDSLLRTVMQSSGATSYTGTSTALSATVDNTGYVVIDQIVGSMELVGINILGTYSGGQHTRLLAAQYEVSSITTPLPAALPVFASILGAWGWFGWRRKWEAAIVAA